MKKILLIVALVVFLAGCSGGANPPSSQASFVITEFSYSPTSATVFVGQPVTLTFKNEGALEHDFVIEKINVKDVVESESGDMSHVMGDATYDLHVAIKPGETSSITFTPAEAGTYQFFCTVAGHKDAGMMGELVVVAK